LLVAAIISVLYIISPPSSSPSSASTSSLAALGAGQWPYYNPLAHLPHIPPSIYQIHLDFSRNQDAPWDAFALNDNAHKMFSWVALSPSYAYTLLDTPAANAIIASLSSRSTLRAHPGYARYVAAYNRLTRGVMRADFLRYLLLALDGGVYSDTDTELLRPIRDWVPDEYKNRTRLVVGVEGDSDPPAEGHLYQVQICQWTLASAKGHRAMWAMVERIVEGIEARLGDKDAKGALAKREIAGGPAYAHGVSGGNIGAATAGDGVVTVQENAVKKEEGNVSPSSDDDGDLVDAHPENDPPSSSDESSPNNPSHSSDELPASTSDELEEEEPPEHGHDPNFLTDEDVLAITGPRGWTLTIYAALSAAAGSNITWHNLTGMREPRLFGDILVLPIDGFATGLRHSGSTLEGSPDAMVRHEFSGSWRGGEA
jgi:mannosyltransferase OCH1-like enzyme